MDASIRGVGAILSQQFDDGERPIAFFSKKLNPAQARYTATEKECLAVILALQHFVVYLLGKRFIRQTDHKALTKLRTMNNDNPRLQRWSISLQQFDFDVRNKPGSENTNADGSSWQDFPDTAICKERGDVKNSLLWTESPWATTDMRSRKPGSSPKIKGTMFCVCSDKCEQVRLPVSICCVSN